MGQFASIYISLYSQLHLFQPYQGSILDGIRSFVGWTGASGLCIHQVLEKRFGRSLHWDGSRIFPVDDFVLDHRVS
jgi:hypothetical protein